MLKTITYGRPFRYINWRVSKSKAQGRCISMFVYVPLKYVTDFFFVLILVSELILLSSSFSKRTAV